MLDSNSSLSKNEFLFPMKGSVIIQKLKVRRDSFFIFFDIFTIYDFKGIEMITIG